MKSNAVGSEYAIIGSCCAWPEAIPGMRVSPEDFTDERCRRVFAAAQAAPEDFDAAVAQNVLGGETAFLKHCMDVAVTVHELDGHCRNVRRAARFLRLRRGLLDSIKRHADEDGLAESVAAVLAAEPPDVEQTNGLMDCYGRVKRRWDEPNRGARTGVEGLDRLTRGFRPGQYILLAARTSVGKSAFALCMALSMLSQGKRVLLFTLEMSAEDQLMRLMSRMAGIPLWRVEEGRFLSEDERERACTAWERVLPELNLVIDDDTALTPERASRRIRQVRPDVVIVDYLGLMRTEHNEGTRNDVVSELSRSLKQLARRYKIPVIALSQLSRSAENKPRPELKDLRDSGSLEQDADVVILLWRNGPPQPDGQRIVLDVAKNRQGPLGDVVVRFLGDTMQFFETDETPDDDWDD